MTTLQQEALKLLNQSQLINLSSVTETGYPRSCVVAKLANHDWTIYVATGTSGTKVRHFQQNPKAGVCYFAGTGNLTIDNVTTQDYPNIYINMGSRNCNIIFRNEGDINLLNSCSSSSETIAYSVSTSGSIIFEQNGNINAKSIYGYAISIAGNNDSAYSVVFNKPKGKVTLYGARGCFFNGSYDGYNLFAGVTPAEPLYNGQLRAVYDGTTGILTYSSLLNVYLNDQPIVEDNVYNSTNGIAGLTYNPTTNTLQMNNIAIDSIPLSEKSVLLIVCPDEDFNIELKGNNVITTACGSDFINFLGSTDNTLTFTGDGNLDVNSEFTLFSTSSRKVNFAGSGNINLNNGTLYCSNKDNEIPCTVSFTGSGNIDINTNDEYNTTLFLRKNDTLIFANTAGTVRISSQKQCFGSFPGASVKFTIIPSDPLYNKEAVALYIADRDTLMYGDSTLTTKVEDFENANLNLSLYPNPTTNECTLSGNSPSVFGKAEVALFGMDGRIVDKFSFEPSLSGEFNYSFNTENIPAGAYIVLLKIGGRKYSSRLNVVR